MKKCLDEAIIQAYIDGELPQDEAASTAAHIAACDACAASLAEAENESAVFSTAFAPDESVSVPTQVLRARINAAVAQLESRPEANLVRRRGTRFGGFFTSLPALFAFTPQSAAAFAGLVALVVIGFIYFSSQKSTRTTNAPREVAQVNPTPRRPAEVKPTPDVPAPVSTPEEKTAAAVPVKFERNNPRRPSFRSGEAKRTPAPASPKEEGLPGEKDYQTAIASLEKTIKLGGDETLRPSVRVEYERNLALIDSAIAQTRQVAAQNPKDRDAVGFLMSAYQSKVDLLTKVADQAQVAALGR
ncbi:MAG TPA: zf-HC2 domain-containing protein [Pyrinomonadaceae bacterium]|nr:zf-HC2 domain-containing protein [Pyrinomonadaceae bacterium]